jgi:hypothetical protein
MQPSAKFDLFPTEVMAFAGNPKIPVEKIVADIDHAVDIGEVIESNYNPNCIKHQSYPFVFDSDLTDWRFDTTHNGWELLHNDFIDACKSYMSLSSIFSDFSDGFDFVDAKGWFYKSDKLTFSKQGTNRHNHIPALLSGVYYLKLNGGGGTEFFDSRVWTFKPRSAAINAEEGYWVIFPSDLMHDTMGTDSVNPRYVVACDLYVSAK